MSDPQATADLRTMQSRLVSEYLDLVAASGIPPHPDALTLAAILTHPDTRVIPGE